MSDIQKALIELIKYGLGNSDKPEIPAGFDWDALSQLAYQHRVGAIALDGLQRCYDEGVAVDVDVNTKLQWIGAVQQQEEEYEQQRHAIVSLAQFYQQHGIRMMVLKGYALSLNYPKPNHRNCCDLDIYLFGEQERADRLIEEEQGVKVDHEHHCHTVFTYMGVSVENHYDFLNVYSHRSTKKLNERLKEMANASQKEVETDGTKIYLPSADLDALFVLRHMAAEFAANGMIMRQLLDWGLFVKACHDAVNWPVFLKTVKELNMHRYLDAVNYICYTYLGFEKEIFRGFGDESYGERVLADLFDEQNLRPKESGSVKYVLSRWQNWWRNRWKHRIVYSDSLLSTFAYQVSSHLMKPATLHR